MRGLEVLKQVRGLAAYEIAVLIFSAIVFDVLVFLFFF